MTWLEPWGRLTDEKCRHAWSGQSAWLDRDRRRSQCLRQRSTCRCHSTGTSRVRTTNRATPAVTASTGAVLAGRRTAEQVDHWGGDHHGVPIFVPSHRPPVLRWRTIAWSRGAQDVEPGLLLHDTRSGRRDRRLRVRGALRVPPRFTQRLDGGPKGMLFEPLPQHQATTWGAQSQRLMDKHCRRGTSVSLRSGRSYGHGRRYESGLLVRAPIS